MKKEAYFKAVLMQELVPATGCTEVGAVALAAGWAVRALGARMDSIELIEIQVDNNTYKNAAGVGIPGTGETGLGFAAAIGALAPERVFYGLQILENPSGSAVEEARKLLNENRVHIERTSKAKGILIRARAKSGNNEGTAVIEGSHDHLVSVQKNGIPCLEAPVSGKDIHRLSEDIKNLSYEDLVTYASTVDLEEIPVVRQSLQMNVNFSEAAKKGLSSKDVREVVKKYAGKESYGEDLSGKAQFITALVVEARMKGLDLPVMSCAGSGNQGLVATIPVVEIARHIRASEENLLRALVLSYLTTIYIKTFTGVLSPICGCGVAAAVGAGCGIVFLRSGGINQIEAQINNMIGAMAGIICDGAKSGCAFKALMAVGLALDSSHLSMESVRIPSGEGIMGNGVLDTLKNLQKIIEDGMSSMDNAIIEIKDRNV